MKKTESEEQIRVRLLGPPTIERNGEPAKVETRKALALLAYLAVERRSHGRASLIALLWPETNEGRGRAVLRRTLHALSAALPAGLLLTDQDQIALSDDPRLRIDIDEVRDAHLRCVESGARCAKCPLPLRATADLFRDDFLAGFTLKDSIAFDDWQFLQAEAFRRAHATLLERLVACLESIADYATAIEYASQWLALDNLDEAPHVALMRLHALAGKRTAALRQYENCKSVIRKEIGEEPSARVKRLAQEIQAGSFPEPAREREKGDALPAKQPVAASPDQHPATLLALRMTEPETQEEAGTRFLSSLYGLVLRHGGRIERHIGQTILVVFGSGSTRESAPELAVRAAIEFRAAARRHGATIAAGINSGLIDVPRGADPKAAGELLSGPAMSEARRLAARAKGDEILVSESTFRNTRRAARYSHVRDPGEKARCYRLGALLDEPRKTRGIEGLGGRLVGRDEELARLRQALDDILRGEARLVTVIGEAGVGKSRLVAEGHAAAQAAGEEGPLWLEGRCLDIGISAAYWPFIDILRQLFSWKPEDTDRRHAERIEKTVNDLQKKGLLDPRRAASTTRHLFLLLSATDPAAGGQDAGTADPDAIRAGIFEAVRDLVVALARSRPLVLVFEDLHWADALTLDLVSFLMDSLAPPASGAPPALGLLCVYRPQQEHRCRHIPTVAFGKCPDRYAEIVVHDLTPEKSAELVEALLATSELPESLTQAILERSQGNPFFLEEIVRSLIDTGVLYRARGHWRARASRVAGGVPENVESVIRGTTDRLPAEARRILRAASVLGRVFDSTVLKGMVEGAEALETQLRFLEDHDLIYEERTVPRREFSFRHVLTRDAVYAGIPEFQRRELHELAAGIILELFGDRPEPYLERLAYHYETARLEKEAVRYLHQAGRKAIRSNDNQAAIGLLERALALARGWPPGPEQAKAELEILVGLGVPVTATTGYGSGETLKVYQQASDLCTSKKPSAPVFAAAYGLWRYHTVRANIARSLELSERLVGLCRDLSDDTMQLEAQRALACSLTHAGRLKEAERVLEAGMAAYDPTRHRSNAFVYGHDPATTFYCYRALIFWLFGFPDRAASTIDRLWELMRDSSHRLSLTYTCSIGAQVFQLRGDVERVLSMSSRGVTLAAEGNLPIFGGFADVMQGWALMMRGDPALGVRRIQGGVERWEAASGGSFRPYLRSLLADAMWRSGDAPGAADLLQETSRDLESENCERNFESEIYRLQGEIHLESGDSAQAEPLLRKAALTAEAAGAPSLQLRAALSLARFHALRGEPLIGRQLVQDAAAMIHEGHATADLCEATRLLKELR
jgi:DNA-binding SARP family transcriptional activator